MSSVEFVNKMNRINRKLDDVLLNCSHCIDPKYGYIMKMGILQRAKNGLEDIDKSLALMQSESTSYSAEMREEVNAFLQKFNHAHLQVQALEVQNEKSAASPTASRPQTIPAPADRLASSPGVRIGKIGKIEKDASVMINDVRYTDPSVANPTAARHPFGLPSTEPAKLSENPELQTAGPENEPSLPPSFFTPPENTRKPSAATPQYETPASLFPQVTTSPMPMQSSRAAPGEARMGVDEFRNNMTFLKKQLARVKTNCSIFDNPVCAPRMRFSALHKAKVGLQTIAQSLGPIQSESNTYSPAMLKQVDSFLQELNKVRQEVKALKSQRSKIWETLPTPAIPAPAASPLLQNVRLSPGHVSIDRIGPVHNQNTIIKNKNKTTYIHTDISHGHRQTKRTSPNGQVSYYVEKVTTPPKKSTAEGSERSPLLSSNQRSDAQASNSGSALLSSSTGNLPAAQAVSTPESALQALNASRQDQTRWNALKTAIVDKISDKPAGPERAVEAARYRECIDLRIDARKQFLSTFLDTSTRTRVNDQLRQAPNDTPTPRGLKH